MNATNQQLAFARIQVQAANSATSTLARRAHWQACILQLGLGLEAYAAELTSAAKLSLVAQAGPRRFRQLAEKAREMGRDSAELNELAQLEQEPSSWLARFNQGYLGLLSVGVESHRSSVLAETSLTEQQEPSAIIKLVEINEDAKAPVFDGGSLESLIAEATALIARQRQNNTEY